MSDRDIEFIQNRLSDPGPALETIDRLRKIGRGDLAGEVMFACQEFTDRLRRVRFLLAGQDPPVKEFTGIDTAPEDPRHAQQVIDHIAHLDEHQVREILKALIDWKVRQDLGVPAGTLPGESDPWRNNEEAQALIDTQREAAQDDPRGERDR